VSREEPLHILIFIGSCCDCWDGHATRSGPQTSIGVRLTIAQACLRTRMLNV
jgi:hypothetical protein